MHLEKQAKMPHISARQRSTPFGCQGSAPTAGEIDHDAAESPQLADRLNVFAVDIRMHLHMSVQETSRSCCIGFHHRSAKHVKRTGLLDLT